MIGNVRVFETSPSKSVAAIG
ncbi:hypothetical protein D018_0776A, partial [Vibrio parahaemolyticus VP2007-007]